MRVPHKQSKHRSLKTIASGVMVGLVAFGFWATVPTGTTWLSFSNSSDSTAWARSSGGRSRGGSFQRSTSKPSTSKPATAKPKTSSTPRPTSKSTTTPRPKVTSTPRPTSRATTTPRPTNQPNPAVVPVPVPIGGGGTQNPNRINNSPSPAPIGAATSGRFPWGVLFLALLILGGIFVLVLVINSRSSREDSTDGKPLPQARDLRNDIVTLTFLQIALDASARDLQAHLTAQAEAGDWESPEGLAQQLQEAALALLREEGYWRGVKVLSETLPNRDRAGQRFEELSLQERSKFSEETVSRVGDRLRQREFSTEEDDIPFYIVVSFLVGTEDDQPLFTEKIYDKDSLTIALQRLGQITPQYLCIFELLWSPQNSEDSLTEDELICEYTDIILPI